MESFKLLIVEDEINIAKTIEATFANSGYQTELCFDGEAAWSEISSKPWDIIFLDIKLPGLDGMEILKRIHENNIKTNVVMITAFGSIEFAVQAMKYGAVDFIQKPFEPQPLRNIVRQIEDRNKLSEHTVTEYTEYIELSKLQIKERDYHKAQSSIRKALDIRPESAQAYNLLGAVYEMLGEKTSAVQAYQMSISFDKEYKPALENIKRITSLEANTSSLMDMMSALKSDK
jgi:DNA-binding NtrC family response regulator